MFTKLLKNEKSGLVLVIVLAFLAALLPVTLAIVNTGVGEIVQVRAGNDYDTAFYAAQAGAEIMYAQLKCIDDGLKQFTPPYTLAGNVSTNPTGGGTVIGTYNVTADIVSGQSEVGIVSTGVVNGKTAAIHVKYGYDNTGLNTGIPLGSRGPMELYGDRWWFFTSWVRAEGPLNSGSTITTNSYVSITGAVQENANMGPVISFWNRWDTGTNSWVPKTVNDANGDGAFLTDVSGPGGVPDGLITLDDVVDPSDVAIFNADNGNIDGSGDPAEQVINNLDAFYYYYTQEIDTRYGLSIAPGEAQFYPDGTVFGPSSVPSGTTVIFVDGDAGILFNASDWSGGANDLTVIATGDITIVQPTNGSDDRLTLISGDDINTGGLGLFGGIQGEWNVYSQNDFNAIFGGNSNGSIFTEGQVYVDTILPIPGLLSRDFDKGTTDWSAASNIPIGLRDFIDANGLPLYPTVQYNFSMDGEDAGSGNPVWHRH